MKRTISILLLLGFCSGCAWLHRESSSPKKISAARHQARAGTMMRSSIDSELGREQHRDRPAAAKRTWREYWQWRISLWRKEKHKDYEQYLIKRRKELGLPSVRQL